MMRALVLVENAHPTYEVPEGTSPYNVLGDLMSEELPEDMSLSFNGSMFRFRTRAERLQFAFGMQVVLDVKDSPEEYHAGDAVWAVFGSARMVKAGRRLTKREANELTAGRIPFPGAEAVERVDGLLHYFPECEMGTHPHLSRSLRDTTCPDCLRKRGHQIRGWRWTHPANMEERTYITEMLGAEEVAVFYKEE